VKTISFVLKMYMGAPDIYQKGTLLDHRQNCAQMLGVGLSF